MTAVSSYLLMVADSVTIGLLAELVVKSSCVLIVAACAAGVLRRASAALRHLIWTIAVSCSLLLPALAAALPGMVALPLSRYAAFRRDSAVENPMRLDGRTQSPLSPTTPIDSFGRGGEGKGEGTYGRPVSPSPRPWPGQKAGS